jgi:hypothetical protein
MPFQKLVVGLTLPDPHLGKYLRSPLYVDLNPFTYSSHVPSSTFPLALALLFDLEIQFEEGR